MASVLTAVIAHVQREPQHYRQPPARHNRIEQPGHCGEVYSPFMQLLMLSCAPA